jgi:cell division septum initiation protein DivIVA
LKEDSIEMKRNLEIARFEFERINLTTEKNLDEFVNQMMAAVETKLRDLHQHIEEQKMENTNMQSQITELRREHSEIQQRIIMGNKKGTFLTNSIGKYEQD